MNEKEKKEKKRDTGKNKAIGAPVVSEPISGPVISEPMGKPVESEPLEAADPEPGAVDEEAQEETEEDDGALSITSKQFCIVAGLKPQDSAGFLHEMDKFHLGDRAKVKVWKERLNEYLTRPV